MDAEHILAALRGVFASADEVALAYYPDRQSWDASFNVIHGYRAERAIIALMESTLTPLGWDVDYDSVGSMITRFHCRLTDAPQEG